MKKSLEDAMMRAQIHSKAYPNRTVYVIDKPRHKAQIYTAGWLAMHKINCEGWRPVASFINGVQSFR